MGWGLVLGGFLGGVGGEATHGVREHEETTTGGCGGRSPPPRARGFFLARVLLLFLLTYVSV